MPVLTARQDSDWDSNVYVITTTRVLVLVGTAYLGRSLYNLVSATWGSRSTSTAAGESASVVAGELHTFASVLWNVRTSVTDIPFSSCRCCGGPRPGGIESDHLAYGAGIRKHWS